MTAEPLSLAEFVDFVRNAPLGVIATANPDGRPEAALLSFAVTAKGELLFNTRASSRKAANLAANPWVAAVIGCTDKVSVQVEGTASVLGGELLDAYGAVFAEQFPHARGASDGFVLVVVRPTWLRRYDLSDGPARVAEGAPAWAE